MDKWNDMPLAELRKAAKELGISGCSSKKKSEIIELLEAASKLTPASQNEKESAKIVKAEKPVKTGKTAEKPAKPAAAEKPDKAPSVKSAETAEKSVKNIKAAEKSEVKAPAGVSQAERRPDRRPAETAARPALQGTEPGRTERNVVRASVRPKEGSASVEARPVMQKEPARVSENEAQNRYRVNPQRDPQDSGITKTGILEIAAEQSFGFIRDENYLPSPDDVYVSPAIIKRFNLTTGDIICGNLKVKSPTEKFVALLNITKINGENPERAVYRKRFEKLTPVFPHERLRLETEGGPTSVRIVDLLSPIGKGQRGMIVSPPKAGKTTLLKDIARAVQRNNPGLHMIILLIDERPEEVTDMKESIKGDNVEIIYSTFDEAPEKHKRVSEMTIEHAKRLVEYGKDVIILLDSITRLARAYNLTCQSSGRTLSGGLDPAALYMPKKFFGAARCMKEGGSLTILATALVDTGSRMDDVVFEEFKGTGNMELTLNRALSERRIFPAIDIVKSGTRREDLLLSPVEQEANLIMRRAFGGARAEEATEMIVNMFSHTRSNAEFITQLKRTRMFG